MRTSYAVVWREGGDSLASGRLDVTEDSVVLAGAVGGRSVTHELRFPDLTSVRVGRSADDRLDGQATLVLERLNRAPFRIASVAQSGVVAELARHLAELRHELLLGLAGATTTPAAR
jgi:hypothetical protein